MSKYSPSHYKKGSIEVWDFITDQDLNYLEGNIVKYLCRAGSKPHESRIDDLLKAKAYLQKLIDSTSDHDLTLKASDRIPSSDGAGNRNLGRYGHCPATPSDYRGVQRVQ
ncbi:nucleotide kinase [Synechococcus phage P60]|uniref:DUF3310 domain-containing protein n=1 Tax=Synechococcus phage P60 TaxID=2905923 RepID=L0CNQ7_9CAUD|nr:nucleotide kinase [Synechococcus phage P60]AGA17883.1 hypothetical protein P60_gp21 [Synechococcus phage P60]